MRIGKTTTDFNSIIQQGVNIQHGVWKVIR